MTAKSDILKKRLIDEMTAKLGNVSAACSSIYPNDNEKAENLRKRYYYWIKNDDEFKESIESISEKTTDFVEGKLIQLINELNPSAIMFYLKCKAKNRGYIERTELDHSSKDGSMSPIYTTLTPEELKKRLKK